MGRRTATDTARLIDDVARGDRIIEDINDPALRETVRLALGLHHDPFTAPDASARARIRSRVLASLRPHSATVADRVANLFELLAKPAPYLTRGIALLAIATAIGASTTVASSSAVSDDALYSVKIASEKARLALAATPEDRAVVELSIAEHRLAEATALATQGDEDDAIVATSEYGEHLAMAAAELAQVEALDTDNAALVVQLQQKLDTHRATALATIARLGDRADTASAAKVLTVLATRTPAPSTDLSPAAAIAQHAANATDEIASVAERKAAVPAEAPAEKIAARSTTPPQTPRATASERSRGERVAQVARKAADDAKAAAQKAKEGSRRAQTPAPSRR